MVSKFDTDDIPRPWIYRYLSRFLTSFYGISHYMCYLTSFYGISHYMCYVNFTLYVLRIQDTPLKSISLKAIHAMLALFLQKPSKSSKAKYHLQALERRIKSRGEADIEGLLYEGMTIQQKD